MQRHRRYCRRGKPPAREGKTTSALGLDSIEPGTEIQLVRYDRVTLTGSYIGLAVIPGKLYALTYDTLVARSAYRGFVPNLNQKITLRSAGRSEEGFFKGVERGEILFQPASGSDTVEVSLDDIDWLQASDSLRLRGTTAWKLIRDGSMPGRQVIQLEVNHEVQNVPYESVEIVLVKSTSSGAMAGFLIGAAVDITALIIAASVAHDCNQTTESAAHDTQSCGSTHR